MYSSVTLQHCPPVTTSVYEEWNITGMGSQCTSGLQHGTNRGPQWDTSLHWWAHGSPLTTRSRSTEGSSSVSCFHTIIYGLKIKPSPLKEYTCCYKALCERNRPQIYDFFHEGRYGRCRGYSGLCPRDQLGLIDVGLRKTNRSRRDLIDLWWHG